MREQTRARFPDEQGYVERSGVRVFWERYGEGELTVVLLPTWSIVDSRCWKLQIPYLARYCRVIVIDGRGNGRSDRPTGAEQYTTDEFAADALAVMDATGTASASLVALSCGALWGTVLAAEHPERIERIAYIAPAVALAPPHRERDQYPFEGALETDEGWAKYNSVYWQRDYPGFLEFFAGKCVVEPRSSKATEDFVDWALQTTPEILADTARGLRLGGHARWRERCGRVRCPTLVIHGDTDLIRPHAQGAALAQLTGGRLVTFAGCGHLPNLTDPVKVNLILRAFLRLSHMPPASTATRSPAAGERREL